MGKNNNGWKTQQNPNIVSLILEINHLLVHFLLYRQHHNIDKVWANYSNLILVLF